MLAFVLLGMTAIAFLAARWWFADLLVHFRTQYLVAAGALVIACGALRTWSGLVAAVAAAILNGVASWPMRDAPAQAGPPASRAAPVATLRIAMANVHYRNRDHTRIRRWIEAVDADVVILLEATPALRQGLRGLVARYPGEVVGEHRGGRDVWMLLSAEAQGARPIVLERARGAQGEAVIAVGEQTMRLVGMHATWPLGPDHSAARNRELRALAAYARASTVPTVVLGDLNVSPASPHFRRLLERGGLRDAAAGRGIGYTWPTFFPPFGIRIDHVLATSGVDIVGLKRGPRIGSDHFPLVLDVAIQRYP